MQSCSDSPGGGGIGGTGQPIPAFGSGLVVGSIDGFGSVIINGQRYTTTNASTSVDGVDADLSDLRAGMTVRARVDYESMVADRLQYQPLLLGTVSSIEGDSISLAFLNQRVLLTERTVFDGVSRDGLMPEMQVEVSGTRDRTGSVIATYVKLTSFAGAAVLVGETTGAQQAGEEVAVVGGESIDFGDLRATLGLTEEEFAATFLVPGTVLRVEVNSDVKANSDINSTTDPNIESGNVESVPGTASNGRSLLVTELSIVNRLKAVSGEYAEMAGIVASVREDNTFLTDNSRINILPQTVLVTASGATISDFEVFVNERVLVRGVVNEPDCDQVSGDLVCTTLPESASASTISLTGSGAAQGNTFDPANVRSFVTGIDAIKVVFVDRP